MKFSTFYVGQVLYESEANSNIVYRKAEALTDCYLDTSTLPWIKVIRNSFQ